MHRTLQHKHARNSTRAGQRGMSVVELLVALGISASLMAGVVGVYVSMFQADRTQEAVSRIQESGRFALNFLGQELRMAGYLGCSSALDRTLINNTLSSPPASFQGTRIIQGWEGDLSDPGVINPSANNEVVGNTSTSGWGTSGGNVLDLTRAMPGTDILRVWYADPTTEATINTITKGNASTASTISVSANGGFAAGDILMLSDCEQVDIVQACGVTNVGTPVTSQTLTLSNACSPGNLYNRDFGAAVGGRASKLVGTVFYIGKRGDTATNLPSLFRRTLSSTGVAGTPEELVEGIENMQILYGENTNNDTNSAADRFVPADLVSNWNNVVSVRIELLVMSLENNLVPSAQPYTYNGVVYNGASGNGAAPPDTRLRRVFTTTINLRNVSL
jgi:type IV pilus assembly protein PilW